MEREREKKKMHKFPRMIKLKLKPDAHAMRGKFLKLIPQKSHTV